MQTQEQKRMADAQEEERKSANDEPKGGSMTPKISAVADNTEEESQSPAEAEKEKAEKDEGAATEPPAPEPAEP